MSVPQPIVDAVNALLAPYGESYTPGGSGKLLERVRRYVSPKEAAKYMGVGMSTFYKAIREGAFRPIQVTGKKTAIDLNDVDAYMDSRRAASSRDNPRPRE